MNISDSERLSAVLEEAGYKATSNINEADLIAVTMCSVRQSAVDRIYGLVRRFAELRDKNQKLKTILSGCILNKDKKVFIEGFDHVIDIRELSKLPQILGLKKTKEKNYLDIAPKYSSKFSANVPIMTGCNNFCAYCVVPYAREREISRPAKNIISEIKNLVKNNYKEIWLLGQNVNSYKDGSTNFPKLLKMIDAVPGQFWIRFTSSHPKDFGEELIDALAESFLSTGKITPYLNLPVQAGDDKVLKSMNRHYTVKDYKNKISKLRKKLPDICLSTDIIVGFPGETKKQFENTLKLFKDIKYDMAYINKYSTRSGTAAAKLKDNVSIVEKKRREKVLTSALKITALEKNKRFIGKKCLVLVDSNKRNDWFGRNNYYKNVKIKTDKKNLLGKIVSVQITSATPWRLEGVIN